jgi:2-dehydropantoate 2-reductase
MGFPDSPDGIPSSVVDSTLNDTVALHEVPTSAHSPSMLLDAENGRPIEVEVIVGEVIRMAKAKGVSIPVSFILYFFVCSEVYLGFAFWYGSYADPFCLIS